MRGRDIIFILILLLGLWLRWNLNGTWRLGPDEALYSTWARNIASGADPWLANTPGVDKPPLFIYTIAGAMSVYGYFEFASRFPGIIASTVCILLTYLLAWQLYRRTALARLAALLIALSPFAILYAPTAFADPIMVMLLLLATLLAAHDRWAPAGVAAALAVLTKQETPLLVPIVLIVGLAAVLPAGLGTGARLRPAAGMILRFSVACSAVAVGGEALWEAMRRGQPSPFALGLAHYGGVAPVAVTEILPRLLGWWQDALRFVFVSPALNLALLAGAACLLFDQFRRRGEPRVRPASAAGDTDEHKVRPYRHQTNAVLVLLDRFHRRGEPGVRPASADETDEHKVRPYGHRTNEAFLLLDRFHRRGEPGVRPASDAGGVDEHKVRPYRQRADAALLITIVYAVLARTLVNFQMWDRYMLVAVPFMCLLLARVLDATWIRLTTLLAAPPGEGWRLANVLAPLLLVAALLAFPVRDALAGRIPVGSDHGLYWGIDETARFVRANVLPGSVVYHHSLGWQLSYYLYGVHLDFWWYPSLAWLATTAAGRAEHSQYIIVPSWEPVDDVSSALAALKLELLPVYTATRPDGSISFQTYRIAPQ